MLKVHIKFRFPLAAAGILAVVGCATTTPTDRIVEMEEQLREKDNRVSSLEASLSDLEQTLASERDARTQTSTGSAGVEGSGGSGLLPPNAKPGECYARAYIAPQYNEETETIMVSDASERIETIPAKYEWVEEQVIVKEASERLEVVPATYDWVTEEVVVSPASTNNELVPAQYKTVSERVMVKPETTAWKKGKGPITKIDESTGEILCLVTTPAVYKTVSKQVLVSPGTAHDVEVPAETKTIKKQVMRTPPSTRKVEVPAQYKAVKVKKLVEAAQTRKIPVPATYESVTKNVKVSEANVEWRPILCETNTTPDIVSNIQNALDRTGYNPGPIDGVMGSQTLRAVKSYQADKGLPQGGITIKTLDALGISIN